MSQLNEETKRKRSKDTTVLEVSKRGHRIIGLPFCQEQYSTIVSDPAVSVITKKGGYDIGSATAREYLTSVISKEDIIDVSLRLGGKESK